MARIGVVLRHLGQHAGGVLVYTHNLLRELVKLDAPHEFVLLYPDRRLLGRYGNGRNIREVALTMPGKLPWDQIAVARAAEREKLDLIFNPKYSVPLRAPCPTAFVCHGLDWYVMPWGSKRLDRLSHRYLMPRYAAAASGIIAVSRSVKRDVIRYLGVGEDKVQAVYSGVSERFAQPVAAEELDRVRRIYRLPERFFLYVGQIYPPKNFGRLLRAFARVGPELGVPLVVAGEHRWLADTDLALIDQLDLARWVVQVGWVGQEDLPAFYRSAELLLLPSLYEGFGLPIVEAMAAGCPVVTSNRGAPHELAGDAAILVDPEDVDDIARGMRRLATDPELRRQLIRRGEDRARPFSWSRCAEETVRALEYVLLKREPVPAVAAPRTLAPAEEQPAPSATADRSAAR